MKNLSLLGLMVLLVPNYLFASDSSSDTSPSVTVYSTPSPKKIKQEIEGQVYAYNSLKKSVKKDYSSLTPAGASAIQVLIKKNQTVFAPAPTDQPQVQLAKQRLAYVRLLAVTYGVCAMIPNAKKQIDVCKLVQL